MKKHLITYDALTVINISEAPEGGMIVSGTNFLIETLENAKQMLSAIGIDITVLEEYNEYW